MTEVIEALTDGEHGTIFVDETPFYATMGGQTGDIGVIRIGDGAEFVVEDTIKLLGGKIGHVGHVVKGMFKVGDDGDSFRLTQQPAPTPAKTTAPPICSRKHCRPFSVLM